MRNSSNIDRVRVNNVLSYMKLVFNGLECATVLRGRARKFRGTKWYRCTVVGNGLTDGQWCSRNFYDLLKSMCCKFLNLNDMTNKKVFVTGKMTLTVSRTQTLSFLDKSCAVRICIHHKFNAI